MIKISNLCKDYGKTRVLNNINLDIDNHEFIVILGPSGCGKTTLLKTIAGLEEISSGEIVVDGKVINKMSPKDRNVSMVFQNYALFPDMTVYQNIEFGLKIRKVSKDKIKEIIDIISTKLKIKDLLTRKPQELSGGEQQRVAIARAMVKNPNIYLFDEPLSNLDVNLKSDFIELIKKIHNETNGMFIYVTHAQNEALMLADKIVVMDKGNILQIDTPKNLYQHPKNLFVAKFIGEPKINIFNIGKYSIGIRPENITINQSVANSIELDGKIVTSEFVGNGYILNINIGENKIRTFTNAEISNVNVKLSLPKELLLFFDENGDSININTDNLKVINNVITMEEN